MISLFPTFTWESFGNKPPMQQSFVKSLLFTKAGVGTRCLCCGKPRLLAEVGWNDGSQTHVPIQLRMKYNVEVSKICAGICYLPCYNHRMFIWAKCWSNVRWFYNVLILVFVNATTRHVVFLGFQSILVINRNRRQNNGETNRYRIIIEIPSKGVFVFRFVLALVRVNKSCTEN